MNPAAFGFLCALPLAVVFLLRYGRLRARMDGKARRAVLLKDTAFLVGSVSVTAVLFASRGAYPLPLLWNLLLILLAAALLLGFLKRA